MNEAIITLKKFSVSCKKMKVSLGFAFILGFVGFATSFGAHIVAVNLSFYAEKVGVGLAMIGVLIAAYDFAEIIAKPVFGGLADKKNLIRQPSKKSYLLFVRSGIEFYK